MRLARIRITNFMGVEEINLQPGRTLTVVSGGNGIGKTSILAAIKAALGGGSDAKVIRNGSSEAEVVLELDDGHTISRKLAVGKEPRLAVKDANGKAVKGPQGFLNQLVDGLSFNPVAFLELAGRERTDALLKALPMAANIKEIEDISKQSAKDLEGLHALEAIDRAYKRVYDSRVPVNVEIEQCQRTLQRLETQLPVKGFETDDNALHAAIAEHQKVQSAIQQIEFQAEALFRDERRKIEDECRVQAEKVDSEIRRLEAELAGLRRQKAQVALEQADRISRLERDRDAAILAQKQAFHGDLTRLTAEMSRLRAESQERERARNAVRMHAEAQAELEVAKEKAEELTGRLKALERYKCKLLGALPIPGLQINEGEIYVDGVHFDKLNRAQQIYFAIRVAKLRAGEIPIVLVDGMEAVDASSWPLFEEAAQASGLQFVVTRVTDGDMEVITK